MRLEENPALPPNPGTDYDRSLSQTLQRLLRTMAQKVNQMADGKLVAIDNAALAPPSTGTWGYGDFVRNSAPLELGTVGNKYVVAGWICIAPGTPGTWVQSRGLTGN